MQLLLSIQYSTWIHMTSPKLSNVTEHLFNVIEGYSQLWRKMIFN